MGKKDTTTQTKLDPMAEKARNIGYNANLMAFGYGNTGNYNKSGTPTAGAPTPGSSEGIPSSAGAPMPGQVGVNPGVTQYTGPGMNIAPSVSPNGFAQLGGATGGPMVYASAPGSPAYEQDLIRQGSDVAGYDKGFGDAYAGTGAQADAAGAASAGGYGAADRFLDPAKAAADAQARMNPYMSGVNDPAKAAFEESLALAQRAAAGNAVAAGAYGNGSRRFLAQGEATRGAVQDYNLANAQRLENAFYNAQGQTQAAGQLGANLGMGAGGLAQQGYQNQAQFADAARQLQQQKYDAQFKDLGMLTDALNGGTSGTTVVERGGGGFFG